MNATRTAFAAFLAALYHEHDATPVDPPLAAEIIADALVILSPDDPIVLGAAQDLASVFRTLSHVDGPECGHSVCSQNFIDTGDRACVAPAEDDWETLWTSEQQERAVAEGWEIDAPEGDDYPEIQRVVYPADGSAPVFGSDACAVAWVLTHAKEGSPLHALALSIHRRTYPEL